MSYRKSAIAVLTISLALLLTTFDAQATTIAFGGTGDPSLHGTTGSLSINELSAGTYDVAWSMNFDGYEGSVGNHRYLTNIAFKAFKNVSAITLDGIAWSPATTGIGGLYPSNVNNGGCADGSSAGMVCITLAPKVDATNDGVITANFTVTGDLMADGWSYRGKFGDENGWVISESGALVPEPSAAIVFGAGLLIVGLRLRGDARSRLAADGLR